MHIGRTLREHVHIVRSDEFSFCFIFVHFKPRNRSLEHPK